MRRLPALAALSAAVLVCVAHPSSAAVPGMHVKDLAGDANGINGQYPFFLPVPAQSTGPAQVAGADILALDVVSVFRGSGKARKLTGWTITLRLAAPVQKGILYSILMDSSNPCGETSTMQLQYQDLGTVVSGASCQNADPSSTAIDEVGSAELSADQKSIVWTMDGVFKAGTKVTGWSVSTSAFLFGTLDELRPSATFTYGK